MPRHLAKSLVSSALLVAATLAASPPAQAESLSWTPCPGVPEPTYGLECTTLDVPLDYADRGGETIELAVSRLPSTDPARRRGVLLLNPGGQGASQLDYPLTLAGLGLPASVRERYDLIMFDPRGIGRSTPVRCDLSPEQAAVLIPPAYARDSTDVRRTAVYARTVAEQCASSSTARLLPHITMTNVARDMDEIRKALREKRVSYLGYSNGSQLGAYYSELFPSRTDRIVLDSLTGPGGLDSIGSRRWARGFEDRFPDFAAWAAERNATYGLGSSADAVRATYFALAGRLDAEPYSGIDGAAFRAMTFGMLFSDATFAPLAQTYQAIDQGSELPTFPPPPGGGTEADFSGQLHLFCNRPGWPRDIATYQRNVERDRVRLPMFGAAAANVWPCAYWPAVAERRVPIDPDGPSNLLLLNNLRDPGTPYEGAVELRRALGDSARMVSVDDGGHQVYLFGDNACADQIVTTYLVDGRRPATDRLCR